MPPLYHRLKHILQVVIFVASACDSTPPPSPNHQNHHQLKHYSADLFSELGSTPSSYYYHHITRVSPGSTNLDYFNTLVPAHILTLLMWLCALLLLLSLSVTHHALRQLQCSLTLAAAASACRIGSHAAAWACHLGSHNATTWLHPLRQVTASACCFGSHAVATWAHLFRYTAHRVCPLGRQSATSLLHLLSRAAASACRFGSHAAAMAPGCAAASACRFGSHAATTWLHLLCHAAASTCRVGGHAAVTWRHFFTHTFAYACPLARAGSLAGTTLRHPLTRAHAVEWALRACTQPAIRWGLLLRYTAARAWRFGSQAVRTWIHLFTHVAMRACHIGSLIVAVWVHLLRHSTLRTWQAALQAIATWHHLVAYTATTAWSAAPRAAAVVCRTVSDAVVIVYSLFSHVHAQERASPRGFRRAWKVRWIRRRTALFECQLASTLTRSSCSAAVPPPRRYPSRTPRCTKTLYALLALLAGCGTAIAAQHSSQRTLLLLGVQIVVAAAVSVAGLLGVILRSSPHLARTPSLQPYRRPRPLSPPPSAPLIVLQEGEPTFNRRCVPRGAAHSNLLCVLSVLVVCFVELSAATNTRQSTLRQVGVQTLATAGAVAAGLVSVTRGRSPPSSTPTPAGPPTAALILKRLQRWITARDALTASLGQQHWQSAPPAQRSDLSPLRKELVAIHALADSCLDVSWNAGVGSDICRCAWAWECDTNEPLSLSFDVLTDRCDLWDGDQITARNLADANPTPGQCKHTRIMFFNVRRFKVGIEGWLLRDQLWDFAKLWDLDWVGLSDHWLESPPGKTGKWDRSGVGIHREARYRASGVQAAAAKGYKDEGWGGPSMTWAIDQGLRGSAGAVAGTLLASRSGWDRTGKEVSDRWGWGRFTGREIVGVAGRVVLVLMVQGPSLSTVEGSQWVQQAAQMKVRSCAGEAMEPNPASQLLSDLYTVLMPHVKKFHSVIVGGDFNIHWGPNSKAVGGTFASLEVWANALKLTHASRLRGHSFNTWKRSDLPGSDESEPDHVFVSQSLADSGAVKAIGAYKGSSVNNSDHFPVVLELSLSAALGLTDEGVRVDPPTPAPRTKLLKNSDSKACRNFRSAVTEAVVKHRFAERLHRIEALVTALDSVKAKSEGELWVQYGTDLPGGPIKDALEAWWLDIIVCLSDAQAEAHQHPTLQATSGKRIKQCWSPTFGELIDLHRDVVRVVNLINNNRCGPDTRDTLLAAVQSSLRKAGRKGLLPPFPNGRRPPGLEVQVWCNAARAAAKNMLGELHARKRNALRSGSSEWHEKVGVAIALNSWKSLFRSELKHEWSSQAKHVLLVDDPVSGPGCQKILTESADVLEHVRYFFARWMGIGIAKWYKRADGSVHILHRCDADGTATRRALVRGQLSPGQTDELLDGLPEGCEEALSWWHRKPIDVNGESRRISDSDWDGIDLFHFTQSEWLQCIGKSAGNKAADAHGVHINLLKALLPPKLPKDHVPDPEMERIAEHCTLLLDLIRRALIAVTATGLVPTCNLDQVLCTLGKVAGSNDLDDTRPLTLISITLNMLLGIQMNKCMHRLRELGAIDSWQTGFTPGVSTDTPLLVNRLVTEHCWQQDKPIWVGDEDKRHAFDSPPECTIELSMDRLAIPYVFILFVKLVGNSALIRVRTAFGLTDPIGDKKQGAPQGGRHSPDVWTICDDPLCTAMSADARKPGSSSVCIQVPFSAPVYVTGISYADDKRFLASCAAGLQRRFDISTMWNRLNVLDMNVKKCLVQARVPLKLGKFVPAAELTDIKILNWATGCREPITKLEPDEPMKSLGMLTTASLFDGYAVAAATNAADRVGICVAKGNVPDALWTRLLSQVAERSALYKVRVSSVGKNDLDDIHRRCHRAFKAKASLCITTPNLVVSSLVNPDWASVHFCEQLVMVMKQLQSKDHTTVALLRSALQQHQLWQGGIGCLGSDNDTERGWDSTLLGRLHDWMRPLHLELRGPLSTPLARLNDSMLIDLATTTQERTLVALGSWSTEVWRASDCVCWDGTLVTSVQPDGAWERQIDEAEPGRGAEWSTCIRRLLWNWSGIGDLGPRTRGSIRLGSVVCFPSMQMGAVLVDDEHDAITLGRVVSDECGLHSWQDYIKVVILRKIDPKSPDSTDILVAHSHALRLDLPCAHSVSTRHHSAHQHRGALYAQLSHEVVNTFPLRAADVLEVKVAEIGLASPIVFPDGMESTLLLQLDEELDLADAAEIWAESPVPTSHDHETFEFDDRTQVVGISSAHHMGWASDYDVWAQQLAVECSRRRLGLGTTLLVISDGSMVGEGFEAVSTYGWLCYGISLDHDSSHTSGCLTGPLVPLGRSLHGGGMVDGPPEWSSSTRAEATGLLAALMGVMLAGWKGDIQLRLDNDPAVQRSGGLTHIDNENQGSSPTPGTSLDLENRIAIQDSDIWTEFAAWRTKHSRLGTVEVVWHPGHPEVRKRRDRSNWDTHDHAIFTADAIAGDMHKLPQSPTSPHSPSRAPTEWSHSPTWQLYYRGAKQVGCIARRLKDAVRTEQLGEYLQAAGIGKGTDSQWLVPELLARNIGRKEGDLRHKVHRAKVAACILGTMYTQHRRNGLTPHQDVMCRLCGVALETDSHVLWECPHPAVASVRRDLSKAVRSIWRKSGLSDANWAVARALWALKADGTARSNTVPDLHTALAGAATSSIVRLEGALIGHTLDPTGLFVDRAGFFGNGWLSLLADLGLDRPLALNTLTSVSNLLQGTQGTFAVWSAFSAVVGTEVGIHPTDTAVSDSGSEEFDLWRQSTRAQLRHDQVEHDLPYRILARMATRSITDQDRDLFMGTVSDWQQSLTFIECYRDAMAWAADLAEAIENVGLIVTEARQSRGAALVSARDIARADAKDKSEARRGPKVRAAASASNRKPNALPPRPKRGKTTHRPPNAKRSRTHTSKRESKRAHTRAPANTSAAPPISQAASAPPPPQAEPTAPTPQPAPPAQAAQTAPSTRDASVAPPPPAVPSAAPAQDAQTAPHPQAATPPQAAPAAPPPQAAPSAPPPQATPAASPPQDAPAASKGNSQRPPTQGTANKRRKTTAKADKRKRENDADSDQDHFAKKGRSGPTSVKRSRDPPQSTRCTRSRTRERLSVGTTNLEPD